MSEMPDGSPTPLAVWKFPLRVTDAQYVEMPWGAAPLTVQVQNGVACLWAVCDPSARRGYATIRICGTGHERTDITPVDYVSTFQTGPLVFHAFVSEVIL